MEKYKSLKRYGQRVKALIQKLTTDIAPSVQVEWYVAGFLEKMGFQIRQIWPATLQEAMEVAQNYENSDQSFGSLSKEARSERGLKPEDEIGRNTKFVKLRLFIVSV